MDKKVKVTVFLPVGVCGCSQTGFLQRVYMAVQKHSDIVEYDEASADSEAAKKAGVSYRGVLVGSRLLQANPTVQMIEEAILAEAEQMRKR
ncbi:MAG: hypothetical protein HXY34_07275 [Candidatus Thorarchaeota archaeon]|nr:hypothetical protein [Candidatus Thorarchaeota archaeon]